MTLRNTAWLNSDPDLTGHIGMTGWELSWQRTNSTSVILKKGGQYVQSSRFSHCRLAYSAPVLLRRNRLGAPDA